MTYFVVDIEADGPIPGDYSMIELGAVILTPNLEKTFKTTLRPISDKWVPEALGVSGYSREETLGFRDPTEALLEFEAWVSAHTPKGSRPFFLSDNNGFDWMFVCWYFHHFLGRNVFGHSSQNINSLYKGLTRNLFTNIKGLRKTKHTHDPVDDARGNAEAMLHMIQQKGLKVGKI